MTQQLTDIDKRCIEILNNNGGALESYPSATGGLIFPYEPGRLDRRRPQGLALCGMRAMRRLESKNIIKIQKVVQAKIRLIFMMLGVLKAV